MFLVFYTAVDNATAWHCGVTEDGTVHVYFL